MVRLVYMARYWATPFSRLTSNRSTVTLPAPVPQGQAPSNAGGAGGPPGGGAGGPGGDKGKKKDAPKKFEPPVPTRVGRKKRKGPNPSQKLPAVYPNSRCKLKLLKLERIKDHLLLEEEFVANQERLKPEGKEDKNQEERSKVDDLRGSPMQVGTLEEIIDDDHAIVSSNTGSDQYVSILSM